MANMEERLEATVSLAETDAQKWHNIIHGDDVALYQQKMEMFQLLQNN